MPMVKLERKVVTPKSLAPKNAPRPISNIGGGREGGLLFSFAQGYGGPKS